MTEPKSVRPAALPSIGAGAALHADALLDALYALCRIQGLTVSRASLMAGLPLEPQGMTVEHAERAAVRAGMATRLYKINLDAVEPAALPAILLLHDRGACVLEGFDEQGQARVLLPQAGMAPITLPREELRARYAGYALFGRPKFRHDKRTPPVRPAREGHWFWGAMWAQRTVYRDVLWAAVLVNLSAVALPMFTMNVYDRVVPNSAFDTLWALALGVLAVITADAGLRYLRSHFVDEAHSRIDLTLSARLMQQVLNLRLAHKPTSVGSFATTMRGYEQVREFIAAGTVAALVDLPFGLLFVALILWIAPWLTLPVVVAFVATVVLGWVLQQRLHALSEATWRASAQRSATLIESLSGLETVKAQSAEGVVQARWERANQHLATLGTRMRSLSSMAMLGSTWIGQVTSVLIVVTGVYLIAQRELTMGALIAVSMLASRALAPASQIVGLLMQYQGARTALASLDELMAKPVERADDASSSTETFVARGALKGAIEFREVSFHYPGRDDLALNKVSFRIEPGERVAFIGRAGSGKSTIQRLVLGLYQPTEGSVLIDGVDARQLDPADLRSSIASMSQDALLFWGSLRENVVLAQPMADDAEAVEVVQAAGLGSFVNAHPQGLNLQVGERGEFLSGGQRQAVALARALLHGGRVLTLDEPTSAMDHASEAHVLKGLAAHAQGRTVLLATHRRSLLPLANRVIVIDQGRVVTDGPAATVMAQAAAPLSDASPARAIETQVGSA